MQGLWGSFIRSSGSMPGMWKGVEIVTKGSVTIQDNPFHVEFLLRQALTKHHVV